MQLLQQPEANTESTNTLENVGPAPSFAEKGWANSSDLEYSNVLKVIIEDRAKKNLRQKDSVRSLIELADIHASRNSYQKAKEYYLKSLRMTNNSVHVLRKFIQLNLKRENIEVAGRFYNILMEKSSNHNDIINYLNFLLRHHAYISNEQLEIFKSYSLQYPQNADIKNLYGVALIKKGLLDTAFDEFHLLMQEHFDFVHGANNLGVVFLVQGKLEKAIESFHKAININNHFVFAYQNLASAYLARGEQVKALDVLQKARSRELQLDDAWLGNLAQLLTDVGNDHEGAVELNKVLIDKYPHNPIFLNNLGVGYQRQGESSLAVKYYKDAARNLDAINTPVPFPEIHGVILNNLFDTSLKLNLLDESIKTANRILKLFPNHVPALTYQIRNLIDEHDFDGVRELGERAYSVDKHNPEIVLNLSYIYSVIDLNNERALGILETFMKDDVGARLDGPLRALINNNLAYNLIKLGRLSEAQLCINKAGKGAVVTSTRALYALYSDEPETAKDLYNKASKLFADKADDFNHDMNILFSNYELANYYFEKKEYTEALTYVEAGLKLDINQRMRKQLAALFLRINKNKSNPA